MLLTLPRTPVSNNINTTMLNKLHRQRDSCEIKMPPNFHQTKQARYFTSLTHSYLVFVVSSFREYRNWLIRNKSVTTFAISIFEQLELQRNV